MYVIYGYMAPLEIWFRTIVVMREEICCCLFNELLFLIRYGQVRVFNNVHIQSKLL